MFSLLFTSSAIAASEIEYIQPTGRWYQEAIYDTGSVDSCGSDASSTKFKYVNLSSSFEEIKNKLYKQNYIGGKCIETINDAIWKISDDWPIQYSFDTWEMYMDRYPNSPRPKDVVYACTFDDDSHNDYYFSFILQPQYQCIDGTCNSFRKACPGDVYAGDLLRMPPGLFGHVGIISTREFENLPEISNKVIEVTNIEPIIHFDKNLSQIKKERDVWGVRYGYGKFSHGEMDAVDSGKMAYIAIIQSQYCPQYTLKPIYHVGGSEEVIITNPLTNDTREILTSNCAVFRCDTFVKYLYKEVLNTDIPPYNETQAPKDLFNAFPNQRGEIPPVLAETYMTANIPFKLNNENGRLLWDLYKEQPNQLSQQLSYLDGIEELSDITYSELIDAIRNESNNELKTKLLFLITKKIKTKEQIGKSDWVNLNSLLNVLLTENYDSRVIVNSLMLNRLMLTDNDLIATIDRLLLRLSNELSNQNLIMINNMINRLLFELLLDNEGENSRKKIMILLKKMPLNSTLQSFSILINDYPEKLIIPVKQYLYNYISKAGESFFKDNDHVQTRIKARSWSRALVRVSNDKILPVDELYKALVKINNRMVVSLIILENKEYISMQQKNRFLELLKKNTTDKSVVRRNPHELLVIKEAFDFLEKK